MLLKILLITFVTLTLAFVFDLDFNEWIPKLSLVLFFVYEVIFCWFHPLIGALAVVSIGGALIITSYEMDRDGPPKHKGLFYIFVGVAGAAFIVQIVETFAGRLF